MNLSGGASEEIAFFGILTTSDVLIKRVSAALRPYGLSFPQYCVLRLLRKHVGEGLTCGQITVQLLNRDPDVTRLLDRLERQGFVARSRDAKDRRVVQAHITGHGLRVVDELSQPVSDCLEQQFGSLSAKKLQRLIRLLERVGGSHEKAAGAGS